nr:MULTISPECIES: alpha/beta family hydrolase [Nocardioides]
MKAEIRPIATAYGEGRLHVRRAKSPIATLLLSHGAGRGVDAPDLMALAAALPGHGISVMLFEQPWHVAGRKVATPPATLDVGLTAAANALRTQTPLVVGGRSAGARSGARCAKALGARGVLALSFPLHPPGKPEKTRVEELRGAGLPMLVVQGERDPMGRPEEFPADVTGLDMTVIPEADHGLAVPKRAAVSQQEALGIVVESALEWLIRDIAGSSRARESRPEKSR